ncbi:MAG: aa3-type cytochrome c oxidase subunit IV [Hyphomicrobiaceae bacterium]
MAERQASPRPDRQTADDVYEDHLETYRVFVRSVTLFAVHVAGLLVLLAIILL